MSRTTPSSKPQTQSSRPQRKSRRANTGREGESLLLGRIVMVVMVIIVIILTINSLLPGGGVMVRMMRLIEGIFIVQNSEMVIK